MVIGREKCSHCELEFDRGAGHINERKKLGRRPYCSVQCIGYGRTNRITLMCENPSCSKKFERTPSDISPKNYCSSSCSVTVSNLKRIKKRTCPKCCAMFIGVRKYCSLTCVPKTPRKYTELQLLDKIRRFHKEHERIPTKREFYSLWQAYRLRFGSWNNAILLSGFSPNPVRFAKKYLAKDGHKCDSLAEKIIDDWLELRKIDHTRSNYYPNQKKYKTDFLIAKKYWVEFVGMKGQLKAYDVNYGLKKEVIRNSKVNLIEIFPEDLFPIEKLFDKLGFLYKI